MRVLIACEYSGRMREAFKAKGHDVTSVDLLPADDNSPDHIVGDALTVMNSRQWDLMIAHPPCTYLANSGARWLWDKIEIGDPCEPDYTYRENKERWKGMAEGARFFARLLRGPVPKIAVENPVMHKHAKAAIAKHLGKPMPKMHFVQPWWFGHMAFKATGFALKGLPPLQKPATALVPPKPGTPEHKEWSSRIFGLPPSKDRWKLRSTTFQGIADACAEAWG